MKIDTKRSVRIFFIVFTLLIITYCSFASEIFRYAARPLIHSFEKKSYNAANQNWSISQGRDGYMYFGNTKGLLEYNGSEWSLYELPDKLIIRSVLADIDGKIYTGAHEEFGYWQKDLFGKLLYTSLVNKLPKGFTFTNEDIWNIKRIGTFIYFQSFSRIYAYNGKKLSVLKYNKPIFCLMEYNHTPVVSLIGDGLYRVMPNKKLLKLAQIPSNLSISNLIRISHDTSLIITEQNGISLLVNNKYVGKWNCSANETLKNAHINRSLLYNGEQLVIGTINNGVYLVDLKGRIVKNLNNINGLQNNTVLSIYIDKSQNLWAGLDKGIDFINLTAPYTFYIESSASIGSVYCASVANQTLYVGTNHGLFYSRWNPSYNTFLNFKSVPNLKGQVWNLQNVDGTLLCGSNLGTHTINGEKATLTSNTNGGTQIARISESSNTFYQGTYTGISIFKKQENGKWYYVKGLANFWSPVKTLQFDHENTIWVGDTYKGLYRIYLNQKLDSAVKVVKYGKKDGITSDYNIQVFKIGNNIAFSNLNKLYTYDYINNQITEYHSVNKSLQSYAAAHTVYHTDRNEFWFGKSNAIQLFTKNGDKLTKGFQVSYSALGTSAVDGFENIWKISKTSYLLGLDNGLLIYNAHNGTVSFTKQSTPQIYKVETFTNYGDMKLASVCAENNRISFRRRNIIFHCTTPGQIEGTYSYYYRLDKNDIWSEAKETAITINSLSSGKHTLHLKSIDRTSNAERTSEYIFTISPPWYGHPIAFIIYLLLIFGTAKGIRRINHLRHRKQKYEDIKKMKELKRIQLENLQKEHLQLQVENKANELANYTMLIRTKNEVLQKIKYMIDEFSNSDISSIGKLKKSILSLIDKNLSNKNDWEHFQNFFDEANKAFTSRLKSQHPDITPNDLRFCSFLRMNLNSKEISQLLNISERSVEVKRYRLRKRLNMEHDMNLITYLMDI